MQGNSKVIDQSKKNKNGAPNCLKCTENIKLYTVEHTCRSQNW